MHPSIKRKTSAWCARPFICRSLGCLDGVLAVRDVLFLHERRSLTRRGTTSMSRTLSGTIPVDIANHLGPSYIAGVIYNGGAVLTLALSVETIPESFLPLMQHVQSTDANIVARFAQRFVEGCVADPVSTLPWPVKLQWMGSFAAQPPAVRTWSHNREQDETRWRAETGSWPVMLIQGAEDTHCEAGLLARQVKGLYGDAEVHILQGVGHAPHLERPGVVNELIVDFVEKKRG
ncbi:uncharacterized protein B0H18DRAFT_254474 [Fomitopsis serialis]|uniref:uncharacterized protein n=1 Tax=Fomitopsis serialis TaxID=139415 RepID=UPI002007D4B9|nr:uncharacterized protein B0H18DRAFT_254474 [Neoantrodia serialis]KAH9928313.1 hypothetical protein B0H18DRAFT_254474 [Neoantrodia serialis]